MRWGLNNLLTLKAWLFQPFVVSLLCNKKGGLVILNDKTIRYEAARKVKCNECGIK